MHQFTDSQGVTRQFEKVENININELKKAELEHERLDLGRVDETPETPETPEAPEAPEAPETPEDPEANEVDTIPTSL